MKPWYQRRFWIKIRKTGDVLNVSDTELKHAIHEFYVPWWAWPLELLHRIIYGKTTLVNWEGQDEKF
jgi:hypothetical protein